MFEDGGVQAIFDKAIADSIIAPFILVAPNYSTPTVGSFFENSSTSGRWIDFTMEEVIPFVESRYRILGDRKSGHNAVASRLLRKNERARLPSR